MCARVLGDRGGELASSDDCFRKIMVNVGIDAGQRELNATDRGYVPALKNACQQPELG